MYSSRGTNAYGQQPYVGQSGYSHSQNLGAGYSGSSVGGPDGGTQMSLSSRHSSILGSSQDAEVGGYRTLPSVSAHYGGQYSSTNGASALSATQQVPAASSKGTGASALEARNAYATALSDSPKFASTDYVSSSSHGYSHKGDQMYADKIPDYPTVERRQFGGQGGYLGRDLPSEPAGRYSDSAIFGHQHQPDIYDRLDQAVLLRQEQLLKAQSVSHDSSSRQADYLAARSAATRHSTQDLLPYGGRIDTDPQISSLLSFSCSGQTPSILGAAPRRNVDNLMYPPSSSNPGYGVSLPPGRDYGTKGLHVTTLESEYPRSTLSRSGHTRIDERKDDRAGYLREFEMREEERRRENLREREKDRERKRERERQRERERERLRILERREKERELEKERERERKRALEVTCERTLPRVSRDPRGPSLTKESRPLRRESPRREVSHRRLSPLKEKRREYVCKVYSSNLTDVERGYLSIDKQYPRLFVSPEFSKVAINWPKENLKLSMHTHVSFEYDYIEDSLAESKELSSKLVCAEPEKPEQGSTVWNAKMILMSGLSRSVLEELSSEKVPDDRIPHICNILRFAVLKKDHSFMAIGGPCVYADGSNPTGGEFFLIQTALRYAKDVNLDLKKCQHWNPFLEIHYDRIGKDGLFSHKEVTVLFVPDLSECLPSLDTWRAQWLAQRKAVSERDRQLSLKREKLKERKEGSKDKEADSTKQTEKGKSGKRIQSVSSSHGVVANIKAKDGSCIEGGAAEGKVARGENKVQVKDGSGIAVEGGHEKKESGEAPPAAAAKTGAVKSVKKKVIKRIVKQKVANKTAAEVNTANKQTNRVEEDAGEQKNKSETAGQQEESSAGSAGMKTFVRKKIIKKEAVGKNDQSEGNGVPLEAKVEVETGCSEDKPKDNSVAAPAAVENTGVKTTIKKKIIKRVPKRKVPATQAKDEVAEIKNEGDEDEKKVVQAGDETSNIGKQTGSEKQGNSASSSKSEIKADKENKKDEKLTNVEPPNDKKKVNTKDTCDVKGGKSEGGNPKEGRDSKDEFRSNSSKESKEKRKPEEPSLKHPGLILQTKWSKDSKSRPVSLSLDSLLDYTDKDIEESTFELSLFAEVMYEMLQYQMGCCILTFLQKLRVRFMTKRNQHKRQREEIHDKETEKKLPKKKSKSNELPVKENEFAKADELSEAQQDVEMTVTKEETTADHVEEPKKTEAENNADCVEEPNIKDEINDEDPEEDPEEYEEMDDASPQPISSNEKNEEEKAQADAKLLKEVEKDEALASTKSEITTKAACSEPLPEGDMSRKERKVDPKKVYATDKDLLQAFRFFDRNRVGYIRVEDMRLIIHSLGKFLSHRDVKELVQSALLESNTGRDDHILYDKLVRMSDI